MSFLTRHFNHLSHIIIILILILMTLLLRSYVTIHENVLSEHFKMHMEEINALKIKVTALQETIDNWFTITINE